MLRLPTLPLRRARRAPVLVLALLLGSIGLTGCERQHATSLEPVLPPPPEVVATTPAARSVGVPYDTEIFVDFSRDMSAYDLNNTNVSLKQDTERVPIGLSWDSGHRRLHITPQATLRLRRTYTVELITLRSASTTGSEGWF